MQFKRICWAVGAILLLAGPGFAQWTNVGTGIDYQYFRTAHPNDVYVTRMLRTEANAYIESSIAMGTSSGAREVEVDVCDEPVSGAAFARSRAVAPRLPPSHAEPTATTTLISCLIVIKTSRPDAAPGTNATVHQQAEDHL